MVVGSIPASPTIAETLCTRGMDCGRSERRERRYQEIHRSLADWEIELRAFHTWPPVIEVVSKIERALLVELLEWRSLLRNMKMPRN